MEDKRVVPKAKGEQVSVRQKLAYQSKRISAKTSRRPHVAEMPQRDVPGNERGSWVY